MKRFSNYGEVEVNDFEVGEKLELGGHTCKILKVSVQTISPQNLKPWDQLVIEFDIAEPDTQAGFYKRKYEKDVEKDALTAKWKGIYKLNIPTDDGSENDENTKKAFKSFITCIEKSNPGYDWEKSNWEEKTLVGKIFAGVFGIREFTNLQGEIMWFTECRFTRSIDQLENIVIPKVKLVDKSFMDYEEWLEKKKNNNDNSSNNNSSKDDDLPF